MTRADERGREVLQAAVAVYNDRPNVLTLFATDGRDGEWISAEEGSWLDLEGRRLPLGVDRSEEVDR